MNYTLLIYEPKSLTWPDAAAREAYIGGFVAYGKALRDAGVMGGAPACNLLLPRPRCGCVTANVRCRTARDPMQARRAGGYRFGVTPPPRHRST
jgi:hypothetical protein